LEQRLAEILKDLAQILVVGGFGVGGLNKLAKRAYVEAAVALNQGSGRRQNNARIAAITGLTRSEVAQLSKSSTSSRRQESVPTNRAQRVSLGWTTDEEFCGRPGKPKLLPLVGKRASFERLVKIYSGDIPARAMLSEMIRVGMARENAEGKIRLLRTTSPIPRHTLATLRAVASWLRFFAENEVIEPKELDANIVRVSLSFESLSQMYSAIRELHERATAFVESVQQLDGVGKRVRPHKLQISIGLATRVPRIEEKAKQTGKG
jgi:hypothetical protein